MTGARISPKLAPSVWIDKASPRELSVVEKGAKPAKPKKKSKAKKKSAEKLDDVKADEAEADQKSEGAEVVSLDSFRKKK